MPASVAPGRERGRSSGRAAGRIGGGLAGRRVARAEEAQPRSQLVAIQRARLLAAAVGAVDELGYAETSVANIVARSRVSRRTFYETFANRDECLAAVLEDALERAALELRGAGLEGLAWRERLRVGLWRILSFLDRDPALARVCVVQALGGGPATLALRERAMAHLADAVDEGRRESARGGECTRLTAEGLVGAAYMIVYGRLARHAPEPLSDLLGELLGLIVLPYLGPAAARREQARPAPPAVPATLAAEAEAGLTASRMARDPLDGVTMRLTYRTVRVLQVVAELSRSGAGPSNRQVADHAGIADPGQVSKLLRRLQQLELLQNSGGGHAKGEPNAWALTAKGEGVERSIRARSSQPPRERVAA
ncbi:MAG TPA: TetR/AcrR family transcriptional regulator [Solirubrobacteraceae bacterium]|jgi:AcrR family transcriptional regulator|nr:TetR/AcrR family transcriptional regulator [Solirubrobacteraceae bacterium]